MSACVGFMLFHIGLRAERVRASARQVWSASFTCRKMLAEQWLFMAVSFKDTVCALANIAIVVVVQCGIMSRCACWSGWGSTFVNLPQLSKLETELM
jgi:hypothetical protein